MTTEVHYQSIQNAFEAGWRAAGGDPQELEELLKTENLWLHDPRSENGLKEAPLKRTGSRGRPKASGSGGNGDPASKSRGGNNVEYANKPFDPSCCARRHWNGGLCSDDGSQAGAQCTNKPTEGGEFCAKCDARYQSSLKGEVDWHGSFAKSIQDDPGTKKDGSNHPWKTHKVVEEDDGKGTALEKTSSKKKKAKKNKKTKKTKKTKKDAADGEVEEEPKPEVAAVVEEPEEVVAEDPQPEVAAVEEPKEVVAKDPQPEVPEEPKGEVALEEDTSEIIEIDGKQYIHDKESDTIYTKNGEPVGNWVDGRPVWDEDTEDMSENESDEESEDESDEDSE